MQWEINPSPNHDGNFLASKINALTWLDGKPSVWAACEFNSMRNLRKLFQQKHEIEKDNLYLSSYWKMGQSEEEHKTAKRIDNEQNHSVKQS
ncbi:siderophore-interacting protein [Rhodopirellula sallentina SM41]|uniref:Siderophore-interacting protein n=1 Tax=Rhodopirellula sallentina SM41 TaxID=1263870 RepID=M5U903_9BACT|nr:siderophore-interacting protein [Rhodopirellula sallentina SM41]